MKLNVEATACANKLTILIYVLYLLHMTKYILPTVKHTLALLCVQVEDKISGVVGIGFLIPEKRRAINL